MKILPFETCPPISLKRVSVILIAVGVVVLAGCFQTRILSPSVPFDADAQLNALREGKGSVTGQAFKKTVGGDVKYGAGNAVTLYPLTPYFRECLSLWRQRQE